MADFKNSAVRFLTGADFDDDEPWKLKEPQCMIVLFYADWCGHCENFKPIYAQFANTAVFLDVAAVNIETNESLMKRLGSKQSRLQIKGYPTVIKFSNGESVGEISSREYSELIKEAMDLCNEGCRCGEI